MNAVKDVYLGDELQSVISSHLSRIRDSVSSGNNAVKLSLLELAHMSDPSDASLKKIVTWLETFNKENEWLLLHHEKKDYILNKVFGGLENLRNELDRCRKILNPEIRNSEYFGKYMTRIDTLIKSVTANTNFSASAKDASADTAETTPDTADQSTPNTGSGPEEDASALGLGAPAANEEDASTVNAANEPPAVEELFRNTSPRITTPFILEKVFGIDITEHTEDSYDYASMREALPAESNSFWLENDWFKSIGNLGDYFDSSKYPDQQIRDHIYAHVNSYGDDRDNWARLMTAFDSVAKRGAAFKYHDGLSPKDVMDMLVEDIANEAGWKKDIASKEIIAHFLVDVLCILERIADNL